MIFSENPSLAKTVIETAVSDSNVHYGDVLIIYAGDKEYSAEIEEMVMAKGIKYGFITLH